MILKGTKRSEYMMQDRHALRCILALTLPLAALLAILCALGGEMLQDGVFAALKLAVIR